MAQGFLDEQAEKSFGDVEEDSAGVYVIEALEIAICALSKCPKATLDLLFLYKDAILTDLKSGNTETSNGQGN